MAEPYTPKPDNRPKILRGVLLHNECDDPDPYYHRKELHRAGIEEHVLIPERCYAYVRCSDATIDYAIMVSIGSDDQDEHLECMWAGDGTGGSLQELRHSYFGNQQEGYIYYVNLASMEAACAFLRRYFEDT